MIRVGSDANASPFFCLADSDQGEHESHDDRHKSSTEYIVREEEAIRRRATFLIGRRRRKSQTHPSRFYGESEQLRWDLGYWSPASRAGELFVDRRRSSSPTSGKVPIIAMTRLETL